MNNTIGPLAESIKPFIDNHTIAGAVLLTGSLEGEAVIEAIGYADLAAQKPMSLDALFWIASDSKPITCAALMMLVDEGRIALDDPAAKYLPEFSGQMFVAEADDDHQVLRKPARPVNVRDLVSHTSGILPWGIVPWFDKGHLNAGSLHERALACALTPLRFEPGTKWEYGNGGFETAGRIIEIVTGEAFDQFLHTRLLDPLGMNDTTFWPTARQLEHFAVPHEPSPNGNGLVEGGMPFTLPLSEMSGSPSPGGGLFSTAGNCFLFCRMIAGGGVFEGRRYLSEAAVRMMLTTQTGDLLRDRGGEKGYGLGWDTTTRDHGQPWPEGVGPVQHGGAYGTNMWIDPVRDLIKIFLIAQSGWVPEGEGGRLLPAFWDAADKMHDINHT